MERTTSEAIKKAEADRRLNENIAKRNEYIAKKKSTLQQQYMEQLERNRQNTQSRDALIKKTSDEAIPIGIAFKKSESLLKDGQCRPAQDALDEVEIRAKLATSSLIPKELFRDAVTAQQLNIFKLCTKASASDNQRQVYLRSEASKGNTFATKILEEDDAAKRKNADEILKNIAAKKASIELGDFISVFLKSFGQSGFSVGLEKEKLITWDGEKKTWPRDGELPTHSVTYGYLKVDLGKSTSDGFGPGKQKVNVWNAGKIRFEDDDLLEYQLNPPTILFNVKENLRRVQINFQEICKNDSQEYDQTYYRLSDAHGNEAILREGYMHGGNAGITSIDLSLLVGPMSNPKLKCGYRVSTDDNASCCMTK